MSPKAGEKEETCSGRVVEPDSFYRNIFSLLSPHLFHPFDVLNPIVNGQGQAGITTMDYYTSYTLQGKMEGICRLIHLHVNILERAVGIQFDTFSE